MPLMFRTLTAPFGVGVPETFLILTAGCGVMSPPATSDSSCTTTASAGIRRGDLPQPPQPTQPPPQPPPCPPRPSPG